MLTLVGAQANKGGPCLNSKPAGSATVSGYVFKVFEDPNFDDPGCLRIYRNGKVAYQLSSDRAMKYSLGQPNEAEGRIPFVPNGTSLTGDGHPDMIVTSWSGGAHCCLTHYIFELKPKLRLIATLEDGDADEAHFERLDHDRKYSYVTEDIWAYWPASFASSVRHPVVLNWTGDHFQVDLDKMRSHSPSPREWRSRLNDVDTVLKDGGLPREGLGTTLWTTTLDLIYAGHSDLAWKFVREANPDALTGQNPTLEEFCSMLADDRYWADLKRTVRDVPPECSILSKPEVKK